MARITAWTRSNRIAASLIGAGVALVIGVIAFFGVAKATDQPAFCGAACHEMAPYNAAWAVGAHRDIACVDCHVDAGETARLTHKFVALGEVIDHFSGKTTFPQVTPVDVPDARCVRCHSTVTTTIVGFNHAKHAQGRHCVQCHATVGHQVTPAALQQAGILNSAAASASVTPSTDGTAAVVGGGAADLPGHKSVVCSQCHKMSQTPCSTCHTPKHAPRGECSTCHQTGEKFVFTHPTAGVDCASCHKQPDNHPAATDCTRCHEQPGVTWARVHQKGDDCVTCHAAPAKHRAGDCAMCHKQPGVKWAFSHPGSGANCVTCHDRPAKHRPGACASCHHNTGRNWAFAHPGTGANCASCHARPAKHNSGTCSSCHKRPGRSWAFSHPGIGANCVSCHAKPAGMPAGQCSNCHKHPGANWSFTHAKIPGGEHTSKSFACVNCHPSGYSTHTCIKCHSSAAGGN